MRRLLTTITILIAAATGAAGRDDRAELVRLSRAKDGGYCHNVVIGEFKGELYAQWQCSDADEDAPDTRIYYCKSRDGRRWTRPRRLPVDIPDVAFIANGGWWQSSDSLTCFVNVTGKDGSKSCLYVRSADGRRWTSPRPILGADSQPVPGIIEQDLRYLPNGRVLTAFHVGAGMICTPYFTDDPSALTGWTPGQMPHLPYPGKTTSREIEPSWFFLPALPSESAFVHESSIFVAESAPDCAFVHDLDRNVAESTPDRAFVHDLARNVAESAPDCAFVHDLARNVAESAFGSASVHDSARNVAGRIVMIFRDQASSFKKIEAISTDRGETWSEPRLTAVEDSRSKQSAGNLPDGRAFMVWNPSNSKDRWPLVLAVSKAETLPELVEGREGTSVTDAIEWERIVLLDESDIPPMRTDGRFKRRGFSYPKSFVHGDYLYIGFAMNKEDAYFLRIPLADLDNI